MTTSQLSASHDDLLRRRVLGVHVPGVGGIAQPSATDAAETDPAELTAQLKRIGLDHEITDIKFFVARRPVALVRCAHGTSFIVKWPHPDADMNSDNEEFWLRRLDELQPPALLRSALPRFVGSDPETGLLVLDGMTDCHKLSDALSDGTGPSAEQWVRLAVAVASMHQLAIPEQISTDPDRQPNIPIPSSFHLTPHEYALGCGTEFSEYVAVMQGLAEELTALRQGWRHSSLIHFDLSGDNMLISHPEATEAEVRLIDWELAGVGDPMYDIGSLISQLISTALRDQRDLGAGGLAAWSIVRPHAVRFVATYREVAALAPEDLLRAIRYAGFGQILSALGRLERIGSLGKLGNLALLIGRHVLTNPEAIAKMLFGASWDR